LVTYFERPHKDDILNLMYRMLKFTPEEKQRVEGGRIGLGGRLKGWVSYLPSLMSDGSAGAGGFEKSLADDSSLADLWVDFLLQEAEKGGAAKPAVLNATNLPDGMVTPQLTPKTQSRIAANAAAMPSFSLPGAAPGAAGSYPTWSAPSPGHPAVQPQAGHFQHSEQFASNSAPPPATSASPEVWPPTSMQIMAQQQNFQPPAPAAAPQQPQSSPQPQYSLQQFAPPAQASSVFPPASSALMPPPPLHPTASITPPLTQFAFNSVPNSAPILSFTPAVDYPSQQQQQWQSPPAPLVASPPLPTSMPAAPFATQQQPSSVAFASPPPSFAPIGMPASTAYASTGTLHPTTDTGAPFHAASTQPSM
jgi:hypothetical protein